ncbi:MAG: PAS domain-containing protein [Oscillatoriales cyanobacterium RM1_1_9]|nr:PAS domain-containing protein [Oscillatoriales cyanobacterium RM1_1_9]
MKLNPIVFELEQKINQYQTDLEAIRLSNQLALESCCQIEQKLRTSQQMLQLVMDTLPERIFWKDRTSSYLGCNQAFARDAGLSSPEELIGKNDYDLPWATTEADFYRQCDNRVMISGQAEMGIIESQLQSDGRQAWLETNKAPLRDPKGNIIGVLGTYQDITPRREAEIALQEVNQKLNAQSTELKAALQQLQDTQLQMVQQEKCRPSER